jgi:hypothetical protein
MIDQRVRKLTPEFMTYTIAKMGLWALTRTSAQALAPHVRVNAIGPGPTMQGARQSAEHFARQRAATVLGRGADPEGICSPRLFAAGTGRYGAIDLRGWGSTPRLADAGCPWGRVRPGAKEVCFSTGARFVTEVLRKDYTLVKSVNRPIKNTLKTVS